MTDAEYQAWLDDTTSVRVVLVEVVANVSNVETTRYLSTVAYNTNATDSPANVSYLPLISGGVKFTEQISLSGGASLSAGDIEINNAASTLDSWLDDVWVNRQVQAFIGDVRWARSDFRMIFNGIVADIDSKDRTKLNLKLRDKLQRLNTPVSDTKLGGSTPNKDAVIPSTFGEVHNISPLLITPATLEYQVHGGVVQSIMEVRDNGIPVAASVNNTTGKFTLPAAAAGAITCSVQGDKPSTYSNTISKLVQRIVTGYGKISDRFIAGDLDAVNLAAFETANQQPVGIYLSDRTNILMACQQLAGSIGAQLVMSRNGLLRLIQINLPPVTTPTAIGVSNIIANSLNIVNRTEVVAAVKLGFCKNYTIQNGLISDIPTQHKDLFATEYLTTSSVDSAVQTKYKLNAEPIQQDSLLLTYADAQAESDRRLVLNKVTRTTYRFEGTASLLSLELGQAVTLTHPRFQLSGGKLGMVVSLAPDWLTGRITVEILI